MNDPGRSGGPAQEVPPTAQNFWATFVLIFVVIAVLFSIDTLLARIDREESRSEASHLYQEGQRLAAEGAFLEAIGRFRSAEFLARGNRDYQLALGEALLDAGKAMEAEAELNDLLQRHANWGPANLAMARVLVRERRMPEATSYYRRAIFGQWPDDSINHKVNVRFELIDLLVAQDEKEELLAELLPLLDEAPADLTLRKRLGHLFVIAGSPERATDIFRVILRKNPQDAEAHAGLGEVAFSRGSFRSARTSFQTAARLARTDTAIAGRLALVEQVLALDPTQRGLGPAEQYRRSRHLAELALEGVVQCVGEAPTAVASSAIDTARATLAARVRPSRQREAYDANLDLAERLWQVRQNECGAGAWSKTDPVSLVLTRVAQ